MNGIDAEIDGFRRRRQRDRRAAPEDFSRAAGMNTGQELDQRGLACTVLSDDGVNFAVLERQVDRLQGVSSRQNACRACAA